MTTEELIKKINNESIEFEDDGTPVPASPVEIAQLKQTVLARFDYNLPPAFEKLLSYSNGILFNGLKIWPTHRYWLFQESFVEANTHLRDAFDNQKIYFGTRDEEMYIYNPVSRVYQGIEYVGEAKWVDFTSAEEMLEFMLARALE
ncbi:MAG: hypothetical protein H0U70_07500 [Tatlockia sp.]|nr:hypothetical protein [Tatlockia sp.]